MLTKRIIPCLDIKNGRTVKGVNFLELRDAGDPVELAKEYSKLGADELVFLDITATNEKRKTLVELVTRIAKEIDIPFTVGGGVTSVEEAAALLQAGADKISVNSAAVENPTLISEIATAFGSQCVVVAVDAKLINGTWVVVTHGGRTISERTVLDWVQEVDALGAGEILLTSMNHDGTKEGFALDLINAVCSVCNLPVIASGGAGKKEDFASLFTQTSATAGLAASIFHYGEVSIPGLKRFLASERIPVRLLNSPYQEGKDVEVSEIDFNKCNGLLPVIIQDYKSGVVLMLGYMNKEAFKKTKEEGVVTFFSRTKGRLWTKGETSKNYLYLRKMFLDCDADTLLILAEPAGETCHTGKISCFGESTFKSSLGFLEELEQTIEKRKELLDGVSYTANLFRKGLNQICKKFGEEASEVIIAGLAQDEETFKGEVADLLYHLLVLLAKKEVSFQEIVAILEKRHV